MRQSKEPGPLTAQQKERFSTLLRASVNGDLVLVKTTSKDGRQVALLCVMDVLAGQYQPIPLAELIDGDPLAQYHNPCGDAAVA